MSKYDSRAWLEIDLSALKHNAEVLKSALPDRCQLIAVVKANAYGHGDIAVSKALYKEGIKTFAVAALSEGIRLRKSGIEGDILILGYTNPGDAKYLVRYKLIQTVVDYAYAKELNSLGKKIRVHLKLDTGMHRLGIDSSNISELERIFTFRNLVIEGIISHLSAADKLTEAEVEFTRQQIARFFKIVSLLKSEKFRDLKTHLQASYGILNYPRLPCDYARAGIALYGILSTNGRTLTELPLLPVMSLKARIAQVKRISAGEHVGYGLEFTADSDMTIAVVTIGYADGIPRDSASNCAYVLLHSKRAPIIGSVSMDQLIIDVSGIENVRPADIVTIIGRDGGEHIRCEDIAEKCGTITNEILCRLGNRLEHVHLNQ